jgi:hypothetical protein
MVKTLADFPSSYPFMILLNISGFIFSIYLNVFWFHYIFMEINMGYKFYYIAYMYVTSAVPRNFLLFCNVGLLFIYFIFIP